MEIKRIEVERVETVTRFQCLSKHDHISWDEAYGCNEKLRQRIQRKVQREHEAEERTRLYWAKRKRAAERRIRAHQLRQEGMIYRKIGEELGISGNRARQLVMDHERKMRWKEARNV